jgi:hypothetical protein
VDECKPLTVGRAAGRHGRGLLEQRLRFRAILSAGVHAAGRGLHSSAFQLNLNRFCHTPYISSTTS